ncbi:MAG TPA: NirD/YgiW/YdeI family stress tolerance protein [Prolixibacteraceae bacterium]|nr:NirD/YgiW/YdeI family stress tolerance protein [Prolixibacteraceae bacterium]HUM89161.1 NirD/YgiW/YdeI family stress tolerance protein [Prolixibacteraceae bacterium]
MKTIASIIATLAFTLLGITTYAQYTGPGGTTEKTTIKAVLADASKLDRNDTRVKLTGNIVEQINNDTYWFKDETGKVKIEISKKHLPETPFNEKSTVTIVGEVDYDILEGTEIEVEQITVDKP